MCRAVKRRLANLEATIPLPLTAERFLACGSRLARRSGISLAAAWVELLRDLSEADLERLLAEVGGEADLGSDAFSADAVRKSVLEAGFSAEDADLLVRELCTPMRRVDARAGKSVPPAGEPIGRMGRLG